MPKRAFFDTSTVDVPQLAKLVVASAMVLAASACAGQVGETAADRRDNASVTPVAPGGPAPSISGGSTATPVPSTGDGQTSFSCNPSAQPAAEQLRRLTIAQYRNTVSDIAAWALGSPQAGATVLSELAEPLRTLPIDRREPVPQDLHGSYRRLDQSLQQEHVDAFYAVGVAVGQALAQPARLGVVVGKCATDTDASNDAACLDSFIARFGAKTLRRPLAADETAFYKGVYGADTKASAPAYADVIAVMMNAPQFLYMVEHGASAIEGVAGVYQLSSFELASRLAYQFWQTAPDEELLSAASDGSLQDLTVLSQQVHRLSVDPRTRPTVGEFTADWLKVADTPALDAHNDDATFRTFAGADLPDANLRQDMVDDVMGMVGYYLWTRPGSLEELLTSKLAFHRSAKLGSIYGLSPWDGAAAPPVFAGDDRPGLLTRALFLTSGSANTRPIQKGVFIRRNILCDELPPPPPSANTTPPQLRADMTTRQVVEELTQKPGTVCTACHTAQINPLGFATENFDALGRMRTAQRLYDPSGAEVGTKAVDTHSTPMVKDDDTTPSSGAPDMTVLVARSGKAHACLARNYFRFTFARWENLDVDGCTLESLRQRLIGGGKIADMLEQVALAPSFRQRTFQ